MMIQEPIYNSSNPQEDLSRARKELAVLYEVSNAMRTTLELNHILYIILTGVTSHTGLGFNRAVLFLLNTKDRCLEPKMAIGPESGEHAQKVWEYISSSRPHLDDLIKKEKLNHSSESRLFQSIKTLKIPVDTHPENLLSKAFHHGVPMHIAQQEISSYSNDTLVQTLKTNELVIMPLKAKDKVKGLIVADNLFTQKPITEQDMRIFMMLANQAGLAIENSQLYEQIMHKSHTDSITELWNHGFFQSQLTQALNDAKRTTQPVSLIILDIDNFKNLNDTYGHQNGDLILKEIAKILKLCSRENDFACRYGGEEFSVILNQTNKEQAGIIAERIRHSVEGFHFPQFTSNTPLKITVSVGISTFPQDAQSKEELIGKADKAMYIAKFSGKNRVCFAE
jgi:diguanylate cyclase (GGDEF)-like protein